MKTSLVVVSAVALLSSPPLARCQQPSASPSDLIEELTVAPAAKRAAIVHDVLRLVNSQGSPLLHSGRPSDSTAEVTFLYTGDSTTTRRVGLLGGPGTLDSLRNALHRVDGTDVWLATFQVPRSARFLYGFAVDGTSGERRVVRDTFNIKTAPLAPGAVRSVFEGPSATSLEASIARADVPKGTLTESTFTSKTLRQARRIWVYRPAGFSPAQRLPLAVVFDGAPYTHADYVPTPVILDNLIAGGRTRPIVAVFIDTPQPGRRFDLWLSDSFADFVTDELIPWARGAYGLSTDARETAAVGSSLGGLTALFVAMRRPNVVGRVISQSGSYWTGKLDGPDRAPEWLTRTLAAMPRLPIDIWMEVGSYESAATNAIGMAPTNARLRDMLERKGYAVSYQTFAGGHEYINWRASLPAALTHAFGNAESRAPASQTSRTAPSLERR